MNNNLPAIIQDSKVVLSRSKNLIGITNKILATHSTALAEILIKKPYLNLGGRHTGDVSSVAFSPDGKTVLSGSYDKTLKLWDVHSGECIRTFEGHNYSVSSVDFSPDGKTVLSGSDDMTLKLWDVHSGDLIRTFEGHTDSVSSVAFSPDGNTVLSGSSDATLKLWDAHSGRLIHTFEGHNASVNSVAFSPDGITVLSGSGDEVLKLWDVQRGECIRTFEGHMRPVNSVAFSPDGKMVLSGGDDNNIRLWDVYSGECIRTFEEHNDCVRSVAFSPDGKTVLSGSDDKTLKLWDVQSGECIRTFDEHNDWVRSVAFSPDGKTVLSGSDDKTLKLWDVRSGRILYTMISFDDNEWISITPDGYFNHSSNGRQYLLVNPTDMSADVIDDASYNHYYRPNGLLDDQSNDNWIYRLWAWADENGVCSKLVLPREKNHLLLLTTLYIFDPWELDPDDAPLFLKTNLPKEIGCLTNLTALILYIGNISELPSEIGKLTALKKLEIHIESCYTEDFYKNEGYVIRSIDRLPHEIVFLKNLTSLIIRGIPNLILSDSQKNWIQELKKFGCNVYIDTENNLHELHEIDDYYRPNGSFSEHDIPFIEINENEIPF